MNRHTEMVKLVLEAKEVHVNAQDGLYGNALQAASSRGHQQILKLLANIKTDRDAISLERSLLPFSAVHSDREESNEGLQMQTNKRKRVESGQESVTKKTVFRK